MSPVVHGVVAVKRLEHAKTRLADEFPGRDRAHLVLAMLDDTLRAAGEVAAVASLTVVTPDPAVAETARRRGAAVLPEPPLPADGDGLNAALTRGAAHIRQTLGPVDVLALQADLPALRGVELARALELAPAGMRSVVTDHLHRGTSALVVRGGDALDPRFGPDSARRHLGSGAVELIGDWPGLRLDVDTPTDLRRAIELGVGLATCEVLTSIGWVRPTDMCTSVVG